MLNEFSPFFYTKNIHFLQKEEVPDSVRIRWQDFTSGIQILFFKNRIHNSSKCDEIFVLFFR